MKIKFLHVIVFVIQIVSVGASALDDMGGRPAYSSRSRVGVRSHRSSSLCCRLLCFLGMGALVASEETVPQDTHKAVELHDRVLPLRGLQQVLDPARESHQGDDVRFVALERTSVVSGPHRRGRAHGAVAPAAPEVAALTEEEKEEVQRELNSLCPPHGDGNRFLSALVFEGGGVKGAMSAGILDKIMEDLHPPLRAGEGHARHDFACKHFDIMAGTSTGALLALANSVPCHVVLDERTNQPRRYAPVDYHDFANHKAQKYCRQFLRDTVIESQRVGLFGQREVRHHLRFGLGPYPAHKLPALYKGLSSEIFAGGGSCTGGMCCGPKYYRESLDEMLGTYFGDITFKDLVREAIIPALRLEDNQAVYFSKQDTSEMLIRHAAAASSAAQTFFRPARFEFEGEDSLFVDGGVIENLPVIPAFGRILTTNGRHVPRNFVIVALGTGRNPGHRGFGSGKDGSGVGALGMMTKIIDQAIEGKVSLAQTVVESWDESFKNAATRIGTSTQRAFFLLPDLPEASHLEEGHPLGKFTGKIKMDNPRVVDGLIQFAHEYVTNEENRALITKLVARIRSVDDEIREAAVGGAARASAAGEDRYESAAAEMAEMADRVARAARAVAAHVQTHDGAARASAAAEMAEMAEMADRVAKLARDAADRAAEDGESAAAGVAEGDSL